MIRSIFQRESSILLLSNPPVNSLAHPIRKNLLMELDRAISRKSKSIIIAGEGKIFSGGADLKEFMKGNHLMEPNLWQMIEYLDTVNIPLTAFVHGAVVGGGFETAIACHWRVATPGARFGLPEVHIGIIPGAGGTQRLPRLAGLEKSYEIISSGKTFSSATAQDIGVLDFVIKENKPVLTETMLDEVVDFTLSDLVQNTDVKLRRTSNMPIKGEVSIDIFQSIEARVKTSHRGNTALYSSMLKSLQAAAYSSTFEQGLQKERELFHNLLKSKECKALHYLFFAEKNCPKISPSPTSPSSSTPSSSSSTSHKYVEPVINKTIINKTIAIRGFNSLSKQLVLAALMDKTVDRVFLFDESLSESNLGEAAREFALELEKLTDGNAALGAGRRSAVTFLFETTSVTSMAALQSATVLLDTKETDSREPSPSVPSLVESTKTADKYLSLARWSSRPSSTPGALEIQRRPETATAALAAAVDLVRGMQRLPVVTRPLRASWGATITDSEGRKGRSVGDRLAAVIARELLGVIESGARLEQVDHVLLNQLEFSLGTVTWAEELRLDRFWDLIARDPGTASSIAKTLVDGLNGLREGEADRAGLTRTLEDRLQSFRPLSQVPDSDSETPSSTVISDSEVIQRLMYPLVNEALTVVEEGVLQRPSDLDCLMVHNFMFPRHRGGLLWWAEKYVGLVKVFAGLEALREKSPSLPQFQSCSLLKDIARSGSTINEELFYRQQQR